MVNKYKLQLSSNPVSAKEYVKKYSKDIVELLVDKEVRYHKIVEDPINVCNEAKLSKVKSFVDVYMGKVMEHRKSRTKERKPGSPGPKRKQEGDADVSSEDPKRHKQPLPAPVEGPTLVVPRPVADESTTPNKKRGHVEDADGGSASRESPKRRRSLSISPNRSALEETKVRGW